MPVTVASLKIHLGLDPASVVDEAAMQAACDAANAEALSYPAPGTTEGGWPSSSWPADTELGAVITAARNYARRGSVMANAAFADLGVVPIGRMDPDVRRLWKLGEFQPSVVA